MRPIGRSPAAGAAAGPIAGFGVLHEVGRIVQREDEPESVLHAVLHLLLDAMHADRGVFALLDAEGRLSPRAVVDRDGLADLLVGAPLNDNAGSSTGSGYLLLSGTLGRGPGIDLGTADVIFTGVSLNDQAAASLDGGGDLDGNGLADLLFGAPLGDAGGTDAGAVYVLLTP